VLFDIAATIDPLLRGGGFVADVHGDAVSRSVNLPMICRRRSIRFLD
jgi:hypothetical protein